MLQSLGSPTGGHDWVTEQLRPSSVPSKTHLLLTTMVCGWYYYYSHHIRESQQEMGGMLWKKQLKGLLVRMWWAGRRENRRWGSNQGRARWGVAATPHSEGEVPEPSRIGCCRRVSSGLDWSSHVIPQPHRKGLSTLTSLGFHPPTSWWYLSLAKKEARGVHPER